MKKYLLIIITAVFMISSVYVAIEASATGAEVKALEEKKLELVSARGELEEVLVKEMSAGQTQEKSEALGFFKPSELIYLNGDAGKDQALINSFSR